MSDHVALVDGPEIIEALEQAMLNAQGYIYITAWMLHPTLKLGQYSLFRLLKKKVEDGIDVRILLSDVNPTMYASTFDRAKLSTMERWQQRRVNRMNDKGIKTYLSKLKVPGLIIERLVSKVSDGQGYPIRLASHHQKSVIIDGKIGFCMGSDLVKLICYPDRWHEASVMVRGTGVIGLEQNFVDRWNNEAVPAGFDRILQRHSSINPMTKIKTLKTIPRLILPTTEIQNAYCAAIKEAKHTIYIQNQYFRDSIIAEAIITALKHNVDVRIILPDLPEEIRLNDENIMSLANSISIFSQYKVLKSLIALDPTLLYGDLLALTRLQKQWPQNLSILRPPKDRDFYPHAKVMIVDNLLTFIGSANLNGRSMNGKCDTELNLRIENGEFARQLRCKLTNALEKANLIAYDETTLERDEQISRIHEKQLHQIICLIQQQFSLGCKSLLPRWLPVRIQNKLIAAVERLAFKTGKAYLHATNLSTFRDRLTNLSKDLI